MLNELSRIAAMLALALALLVVWQPNSAVALKGDEGAVPVQCDVPCKFCDQGCVAPCSTTVPFPRPEAEFSGPVRPAESIRFSFARRATVGFERAPDTGPPRHSA